MEDMARNQKHASKAPPMETSIDIVPSSMNSSLQSVVDDTNTEDLALMEGKYSKKENPQKSTLF